MRNELSGEELMSSVNKVFLMGNLTKAPELKFTPQGTSIANFSIAVNRSFKAESGELKKQTFFFNVIAWGKLGETCAKFLPKGRQVHVEGRLQNRSYETIDKKKRTVTEIIAENVQFLGSLQKPAFGPGNDAQPESPGEVASEVNDQSLETLPEDIPF